METHDLVEKLSKRGITLALDGLTLRYTSDKPIPKAIITTIKAHQPALRRYLKAQPTATPASMQDAIPKAQHAADSPIGDNNELGKIFPKTGERSAEQDDSRPATVAGLDSGAATVAHPPESATVTELDSAGDTVSLAPNNESAPQNDVRRRTSLGANPATVAGLGGGTVTVTVPSKSVMVTGLGLSVEQDGQKDLWRPKSLGDLRALLNSGQLDGRSLTLCGYPYGDIGAEVREHIAFHDRNGGLCPNGRSAYILREVMRALQSEATA